MQVSLGLDVLPFT